jgi:hypothetical protein
MRRAPAVLFAIAAVLAAAGCRRGDAPATGPRVGAALAEPTDAAVVSAVRDAAAAAIVALDQAALAQARAVRPQCAADMRILGVADATTPLAGEVLVAPGDAAAVAVDMALLACHGVTLPPKVALGARTLAAENAAAGGVLRPGPGDVGLAVLARQYAPQLATKPTTDVVFRLGIVASAGGDGWPGRAAVAAQAAAARYPQLAVEVRAGDGTAARATALLNEFLDGNVRVLVVALADPAPLAAVAARAAELRIPIVAIDPDLAAAPAACVVGADPAAIGRALAEAARGLAGGEGAFVLLRREPATAAIEAAFRAGLAPKPQ